MTERGLEEEARAGRRPTMRLRGQGRAAMGARRPNRPTTHKEKPPRGCGKALKACS